MSKSIFQTLGLVEDDSPPSIVQKGADTPPVAGIGTVTVPPVFSPGSYGLPSSSDSVSITLSPDDEARFESLKAQVFATRTPYVIFDAVWHKLNCPPNTTQVFDLLSATNPDVTIDRVRVAIDAHLAVITDQRKQFESQIARMKADKIDGVTTEIASLTQQVQQAQTRVAQLQESQSAALKSVADSTARFKIIEDRLQKPLLQAKSALSGVTPTGGTI